MDALLTQFSAFKSYEVLDKTDATLKVRIYIERELYIQLYANAEKRKLNLALVHHNQRIYGEDSEGFDDPDKHVPIVEQIPLEAFLAKVQQYGRRGCNLKILKAGISEIKR